VDGVEGVMSWVELLLRGRVPAKLAELRTRYDIVDGSLEDITRYLTHEPDDVAIDQPPLVVIAEQQSDSITGPVRAINDGAGGATYRWRYSLLIMVWARGTTFAQTSQVRRRYGLAVREVLLQTPGINAADPDECVLIPELMAETYSDVSRDGAARQVIAATAITVVYEAQEHLGALLPPLGVAAVPPAVIAVGQ
jgi:hypothetical protein